MRKEIQYIVGIDEAGRGPLAGPVSVGAVVVPVGFPKAFFKHIRNSKALSLAKREEWFSKLKKQKILYSVSFSSSVTIDKKGIAKAVRLCIARLLKRLKVNPKRSLVLLDGSLKAPPSFSFQKTIIGGDEKEPIISLASIIAKVLRDRRMVRYAKLYPNYSFEIHKGYGTSLHIKRIKKHGPSLLHRRSFLKNII
ncbi:MAG: ribonuclease HII [Patescibacteria group bacterium]|nr:ribonuclease HII [bacterium]MDZ4240599.1 ribonuclease HII [Patescibacteria group bacterium]